MSTDTPTAPATPLREVDLAVTGMTCASCVARVERKLQKLPGVVATVNLPLESAHVILSAEHDDAALIRAVEAAGYGARVTGGRRLVDEGAARSASEQDTPVILRERSESQDPGLTSDLGPATPVAEPVLRERQRDAVLPARRMTEGGGPAGTSGGTAVTGGGSTAVTGGGSTAGPGGGSDAVTGGDSGTSTPGTSTPGASTGASTDGSPSEARPTQHDGSSTQHDGS